MPLVQLSNGKAIFLTIEQYLSLEEDDYQYLVSTNYGRDIGNPFHGSVIRGKGGIIEDNSIDYEYDEEEPNLSPGISSIETIEEDFPDLPDDCDIEL